MENSTEQAVIENLDAENGNIVLRESNQNNLGGLDLNEENTHAKDNPDNKNDAENSEKDNEIYGSPENYDYSEIQLPEGMTLDDDMLKEFNPLAKKFNLSNSSANELMKLAVKLVNKNATSTVEAIKQAQIAERNSYMQQLNTDNELNAKNTDEYDKYLSIATDGLKAVSTDGFSKFLKEKGLTHHPEFIKVFHKIGLLCQSGKIPDGKPVGEKETAAQILYGGSN